MIYLNGRWIESSGAKIENNDRGFLLGDGLFETIRISDGIAPFLSDHYNRLKKSADKIRLSLTITYTELENIVEALLEKNGLTGKNASVRLTLTRGTGPRGILPPPDIKPTIMVAAFSFSPSIPKPIKAMISDIRRNIYSPTSSIKSLCYLDNIIARQQASESGFDDCIFLNTKGAVACSSVGNIFIVNSAGIITPSLTDGILPGITRMKVIALCKANNITISEQEIKPNILEKAEEVFFTNSLIGIQPVIQINNILINNGKPGNMVSLLQKLFERHIYSVVDKPKNELSKDSENFFIKCKL